MQMVATVLEDEMPPDSKIIYGSGLVIILGRQILSNLNCN